MWQTKATLWSLLLLVSFGTCSPETSPLPYGLLFTPSSILASIQSPEGKTYVTHFDPPAEYLAYYADAVAHYHNHVYYNYTWYLQDARTDELIETRPDENVFDQSPANEMFKTIIETVDRSMKENYFDRQVLLSQESIFMPSIFNESSRVAAMTGALNSDIGLQGVVFNHGSISKAAVYAYGLDKCENFGWGKEVCEDHKEHPADLVLVVEYEKDYLFLELVHSDLERKFGYFWKLEPEMLLDFGEESGRLMRERIGHDAYTAKLRAGIKRLVRRVSEDMLPRSRKGEIRAMIFVGEASEEAMSDLKDVIVDVVGEGNYMLLGNILPDGLPVLAHGAALHAGLNPSRWVKVDHESDQSEL